MRKIIALALFMIVVGITMRPTQAQAEAPAAPEIVDRAGWDAKAANTGLMKPQTPHEIIVHHTSVRQQPNITLEQKMRGLQGFSMSPGKVGSRKKPAWGDVPYHFYIDVTGRTAEGRSLDFAGDTNTGYSVADRIQVVLEGHFDTETPSEAQLSSLKQLVAWLAEKYDIAPEKITGHNDHASTDCPGKNLKAFLPTLRESLPAQ